MKKETTRIDHADIVKHRASVDMKFANSIFDKLASEIQQTIDIFKNNEISDEDIERICPAFLMICQAKRDLEKMSIGDKIKFTVTITPKETVEDNV
ncbi:hypothetical protein EZS27_021538 [termite gut metagenome]|uniref:Uncharacterized protein n=1 Tax=termite gut metagenome TaxID=433724 RepID=A0A5J4R9D2_9ZZZZ